MKKDIYVTITQASDYLGLSKNEVKDLVKKGILKAYKAMPNDVRFLLSMREVNKLKVNQNH
ncbi:MAG: helix-turn-helix domain-containing protein [Desulfotomaculaceae bacterium]|nr:helix-turn-helix domain-containing protein [Desulfotomaculaceae bacterium]